MFEQKESCCSTFEVDSLGTHVVVILIGLFTQTQLTAWQQKVIGSYLYQHTIYCGIN